MINIRNLNDLVFKIYSNYSTSKCGLDFENKVNEDVELLEPYVTNNTDYNAVYRDLMTSRVSKPPIPVMIEAIKKNNQKRQAETYINDVENGKMIIYVCYKNSICREIRDYIIQNGGNNKETKTNTDILKDLKERFTYVKVLQFSSTAVLYRDEIKFDDNGDKIAGGEVWEIGGYDRNGNVTSYNKTRVA